MKILYAVQATGNGHVSRAIEILPFLKNYGEVDIFLSGSNSHLPLPVPVTYRSKGISLYYSRNGGLDYWQMLKGIHPFRIKQEIRDLPVEKYDVVLNDFDYITSAACVYKGVPSIHFGHQASFRSPFVPRPASRSLMGEWILKRFVSATHHVGLHFSSYDDFIFPPILSREIVDAEPVDKGHITVYLPSWNTLSLAARFGKLSSHQFHIFSNEYLMPRRSGNILFIPVSKPLFRKSLVESAGVITGAGFETPAEALHLGKKMICIPVKKQYEQLCNETALKQMNVRCLTDIDETFAAHFQNWMEAAPSRRVDYSHSCSAVLDHIFRLATRSSIAYA